MKNKNRQLVRVKILFNFVNNLNEVTEQMNVLLDFFLELIHIKNKYYLFYKKAMSNPEWLYLFSSWFPLKSHLFGMWIRIFQPDFC